MKRIPRLICKGHERKFTQDTVGEETVFKSFKKPYQIRLSYFKRITADEELSGTQRNGRLRYSGCILKKEQKVLDDVLAQ